MDDMLEAVNRFVWGVPALLLILGVGIYLTVQTGFLQFSFFPQALRSLIRQLRGGVGKTGGSSAYRALCTALAATVGTGNIAGVAGAIAIGGPGAMFWMWICGLLGMITKFAEATLAVRYRVRDQKGEFVGGPMYMIRQGMGRGWKWLAAVYSIFGIIASFGVGNASQINALVGGVNGVLASYGISGSFKINLLIGGVLAVLIAVLLLGGAKTIGATAEKLVPFASALYLLLCVAVLVCRAEMIPGALAAVFRGAFSPQSVTGGVLGAAFCALRTGAARGTFTNEAGMGTAAIAHASARVAHPVDQGLMGIVEVFLDTIVICTMTGLAILCSGVQIPYGQDTGVLLTNQAFCATLGEWVSIPLAAAVSCFAIATVLGWGLYGARCSQYLFGEKAWGVFVYIQAVSVLLGAVMKVETVWTLSEITNGLMAIPNLIALIFLSPELFRLVGEYKERARSNDRTRSG